MIPLLAFILIASVSEVFSDHKVIVLAFDGFRPDYYNTVLTPELYNLRNISAGPDHMVSIFPTKTLATLHSVSTGVYPDKHGIYGNEMFDNDGGVMNYSAKMFNGFNEAIIPIWIENQNKGGKSGVMMWPGGEFEYMNVTANHFEPHKATITWQKRADKIVKWIKNDGCNLVMAYFEDYPCYDTRQLSKHIEDHTTKVDNIIKNIRERIPTEFDMVIMSDHGVATVPGDCVLIVEDYVTDPKILKIVSGPLVFLKVPDTMERNNLVSKINGISGIKFSTYTKENLFDCRIKQLDVLNDVIILVAQTKCTFMKKDKHKIIKTALGINDQNFMALENGYDQNDKEMNAFFLGIGPSFKKNEFPKNVIQLIDVYPLLKALLLLKGNASDVQNMTKLNDEMKKFLVSTVVEKYENDEKPKDL